MKYNWSHTLTPKENIVREFSLGDKYIKWNFYSSLISGVILLFAGIGFIILPVTIFYWKFYVLKAYQYAFTNKRVLVKSGWINTKLTSIDFNKITDIQVHESFFSKKFYKTGTLIINTAGTSTHEVVLKNIESPHKLRQTLLDLSEKND